MSINRRNYPPMPGGASWPNIPPQAMTIERYLAEHIDTRLVIEPEFIDVGPQQMWLAAIRRRDDGAAEFEAMGATISAAVRGLEEVLS